MKKFWIVFALTIAAGLFAGYQYLFSGAYEWNQKAIIRVKTPYGIREGSSVIEIVWREVKFGIGDGAGSWNVDWHGEMPFIKLNKEKYLFAIFQQPEFSGEYALFTPLERKMAVKDRAGKLKEIGQAGILPPKGYPLFVTFDDVNDPTTLKRADLKDWPELFGDGVELASIQIEITDQSMTQKIEAILPWLRQVSGSRFRILPGENGLMAALKDREVETLTTRHFSTELTQ